MVILELQTDFYLDFYYFPAMERNDISVQIFTIKRVQDKYLEINIQYEENARIRMLND